MRFINIRFYQNLYLIQVPPFFPQVTIINVPAYKVAGIYFHKYKPKFKNIHNWADNVHFCYVFLIL